MIWRKNNRQMKFIFFVCLLLSISTAISALCYETGNFTSGSTYADNRRVLLSSLASNATANGGFFTTAVGQGSDTVYGLALCVTNLSPEDCSSCVSSAVDGLIKSCPNQKEAISWGGDTPCIVRYANRSISGKAELEPSEIFTNTGDIRSNMTQFDQVWDNLIGNYLIPRASMGSTKKYAAGIADLNEIDTSIYALMECTPDISQTDCRYCLQQSAKDYNSCCHGKRGGPVTRPSCFFRWDMYPFYNAFDNVSPLAPPPPPQSTASPPPTESIPSPSSTLTQGKKKSNTTLIAIIVSVVVFLIVIVCVLFIFVCARKRKVKGSANVEDTKREDCEIPTMESLQYDFRTIEKATQNFAPRNKLGEGGFGEVYEGTLANGEKVAVKRLSRSSRQGAEEFKNEAMLVAKLQHRNLVRLLGFCLEREENILVYEFVPNKSLDYFLFDHEKRRQLLWSRRSDIIAGIARGMLYLHEDSRLRVIHRDLKASNVLLDENMAPKISDFGTARIFGADQTQTNTGRIVGTFGYMAPEYVVHGQISLKSDVYSFGILVLEIICGKRNNSFGSDGGQDLVSNVWNHWRNGAPLEVLDPSLMDTHSRHEAIRCIHIGLLCVQEDPAKRPTMATVVLMLSSYSTTLPLPQEPAYFPHTRSMKSMDTKEWTESDQSRSKSVAISVDEESITQVYPR